MSGVIRQHFLSDGDALDFRRVEELFLEAAGRWSQIQNHSIGDSQFWREAFTLDSWQEYRASEARGLNVIVPDHAYVVADCIIEVVHDDSFMEASISWSIDVLPKNGQNPKAVMAWPVVAGKAIYGGEDMAMAKQLNELLAQIAGAPARVYNDPANQTSTYTIGADDPVTLGNRCNVQVANGRSHAAICVMSIGGFEIKKSSLVVRKVLR